MLRAQASSIRRLLPRGQTLPDEIWSQRHTGVLVLLCVHSVVIPVFGLIRGFSLLHVVLEGLIVPVATLVAASDRFPRRVRTASASVGLLSSSAVLVHLSGGVIEMHFHFFVMVAVVALYQDWIPFLASIGYVLVHHGAIGALDPRSVYNHPAAWQNPWKWAAIHAFFIAGISAACLVTWRLNESILDQRRHAEDRLREETHIVETLNEVGKALAAELDLQTVVQHVTDAVRELTAAQFGAFFYNVIDPAGESYMLYTLSGPPPEAFSSFPMPRNTAIFSPTFTGEAVMRLDDVTKDPRYGLSPPHYGMPEGHLPVRSYLAVPVRSRTGEVLGGLFFGHSEAGRFGEVDERVAVGVAAHAAVAIDNARLYEAQREAREASERASRRLALLADAGRVLSSSLDHERILRDLAVCVVPALADGCAVFLDDGDGELVLVTQQNPAGAADAGPVSETLRRAARQAVRDLEAVPVGPTSDTEEPDPDGLALPLVGRTGAFGAVVLTNSARSQRFGEEDLYLVEELARRASIAVENARLYATQRTAAETLQHSLLPDALPEMPGLTTAARYLPGGVGAEIGGDWYDVFPLPSGSVAFAMGDVVGRGVPAASLMGQLRNSLRAYALEGHGPAEILSHLNGLISDAPATARMATLVLGLYDIETGDLRIGSAGHPPPIVIDAAGHKRVLDEPLGAPLGVLPRPSFRELRTTLEPGSTLLLYTDGLIEDRTMPLDEGISRLIGCLDQAPSDVEAMCDHIIDCALAGRDIRDDVAVLVLHTLSLGPKIHLRVPSSPRMLLPLRSTLRRWLAAIDVTDDEAFEILVASGEACANSIRHAGESSTHFELEGELDGRVRLTVRDSGRWREQHPSRRQGGRGLEIMRQFMDDVQVQTGEQGTEVTLVRSLASSLDGT